MNERIDVLAVMDAEVVTMRRLEAWVNEALAPTNLTADEAIARMEEARAAVAELIEAAKDEQAQACGNFKAKSCGHDGYCICPGDRLRAALARVGGEP